jgi:phage recombination protein Bet
MTTSLAISTDQSFWTDTQISALKTLGLSNATKGDLTFFFHQAQRTGLDPFARQIYMIERGGRFTIQTSIDGFRIIAQRSGKYRGQAGPFFCGEDGKWSDVWLKNTPPLAAKVGVYAEGWTEPLWAVAKYDSYAQQSPIWKKMPDLMLAKCAESLALRKAFPNDLSGIYTDDEMNQADVVEQKVKPQRVVIEPSVVVESQVKPTTTLDIDWESLLKSIDETKSKIELKKIFDENAALLDTVIPNTTESLRSVILDKKDILSV